MVFPSLQIEHVAGRQVVEDRDAIALGHKKVDGVAADKSGAAGNEYAFFRHKVKY